MMLPQYQSKMLRFFELAFQQTQITVADYADQVSPITADINATTGPLFVQNASESFARTMLALVSPGPPFTDGDDDEALHDDAGTRGVLRVSRHLAGRRRGQGHRPIPSQRNPNVMVTVEAAQGPIPIAETLDPTSPNYMHWYDPDVATRRGSWPRAARKTRWSTRRSATSLHYLLLGGSTGRKTRRRPRVPPVSAGRPRRRSSPASDYSTWKMVTIRAPAAGESPTAFYDLQTLRTSNELVLAVPRIGFFSTPAFFANWQTNASNQMRVTTNQALIVALGSQVDGTDATNPPTTPGLDTVHASQAACVGCHKTLDPTRSIMASTYSWNYHNQVEAEYEDQQGLFAFENVIKPMANITDFASTLATHPLFAQAWAQKLCYYANSSPCQPTDPEFQRIVGDFKTSGFQWNMLVRELMSSPITTNASRRTTRDRRPQGHCRRAA